MTVGARVCLIRQPAGLGDIILCQKIADFFVRDGYEVWWPVIDDYYDTVNDYMKTPGINFCRQSDDYPLREQFELDNFIGPVNINNNIYLPLHRADRNYSPTVSSLKSKYFILNMDYNGWQNYFKFSRNEEAENILFYDVLKLDDHVKYSFVNMLYASPPEVARKSFDASGIDSRVVEMSMVDGYTIFDWCKVIEKASQIYCVDTSLFYIIDLLDLKATRLEAYSKFDPPDYMHIDGLFNTPWKYN